MGEGTGTASLQAVWEKIQTTVTENIGTFWTVAASVVGAIAVIWFCRLGLRLLKNMASTAS